VEGNGGDTEKMNAAEYRRSYNVLVKGGVYLNDPVN